MVGGSLSHSNDGKMPSSLVLAQTWHTRIPVHLSLATDNISSPSAVRPIYLMAPRQGYLNVLAAQAWPHLQHVLPSPPGRGSTPPRPWFDYRGIPLKGHLPVGVLHDLLVEPGDHLPWKLTVHYTHPPDALVAWDTGNTPQAQYLNALKEACHVLRGTEGSGAVMRLGAAAGEALWGTVAAGDVAGFRAALEAVRAVPTARQGQPPNIPVRVLLRRAAPAAAIPAATPTTVASASASSLASSPPPNSKPNPAALMAVWEQQVVATSRPVPATQQARAGSGTTTAASDTPASAPEPAPTTLAQLLHIALPHIFPNPDKHPPPSEQQQQQQQEQEPVLEPSQPQRQGSKPAQGQQQQQQQQVEGEQAPLGAAPGPESQAAGQGAGAAAGPGTGDAGQGQGGDGDGGTAEDGQVAPVAPEGGGSGESEGVGAGAVGPVEPAGSQGGATAAAPAGERAVSEGTEAGGSGAGRAGQAAPPASSSPSPTPPGRPRPSRWPACRVQVGGVVPPLGCPVGWLHAAMAAPDQFLYVVVRMEAEEGEGEGKEEAGKGQGQGAG